MSQLILVRHGQATPFEADTDRLSPLGEAQARAVGEYLAESGLDPTDVISGSLVRQRESARLASEGAGGGWPDPVTDPRLAEYDGDGLIRTLAPLLAARDPGFDALLRASETSRQGPDRNRHLQRMLEPLAAAYLRGEVAHADVEPWAEFRARVHAFLRELLAGPSGRTVLAFTSGGVIGVTVAAVLRAPDESALTLNWRVRNGSLTRLTYGGGRASLDSFNETAHLTEALSSWR
ncbi:broad specificity phosphatase PhoE [Deinococcus sp. HSC-46F16]|uniref:histidine phosphatase family protein n=1 Tax=Deinococcus sp. HSC-46F16 TaxID=2910968 RepID=UPI0020A19A6D|nr:histidine phosphatase family protein [Deinococcus sp. HSC-46F16]MCP2014447.1 broad specificity phosphatase PhoE [Deinococcus sp. HSC-46F16]